MKCCSENVCGLINVWCFTFENALKFTKKCSFKHVSKILSIVVKNITKCYKQQQDVQEPRGKIWCPCICCPKLPSTNTVVSPEDACTVHHDMFKTYNLIMYLHHDTWCCMDSNVYSTSIDCIHSSYNLCPPG